MPDNETPPTVDDAAEERAHLQRIADRSAREAVLRDLYAIAAFYIANPDHPLPWQITLNHHVADLDAVHQLGAAHGARHGGEPYPPESPRQTDWELPNCSIPVSFIVAVPAPVRAL